jgi:predicted O-methyltransferase YrrM
MLCHLVREFGCRRVLEIGMANGSSTVMLLRAHYNHLLITVDEIGCTLNP